LSSFADPFPTLFAGRGTVGKKATASQSTSVQAGENAEHDIDAQLRNDVRTMGALLGKAIRQQDGEDLFHRVEVLRGLCKSWRGFGAGRDASKAKEADNTFKLMATFASSLSDEELVTVSRAFAHFLALTNAAESHHRARRIRNELSKAQTTNADHMRALPEKRDSCGGALADLVSNGADPKALWDSLIKQEVEIVLTAHPTEVNRRTILEKHKRIQDLLTQADGYRDTGVTTPYLQQRVDECLQREIASIWQSDEVARTKPKVQTEAQKGTLVIETVLWEAVPSFLRKLDVTMRQDLGSDYKLPLDAAPLRFASWMGGDRDGNPNVTPQVTREVCLANREKAALLFKGDLLNIAMRLSSTHCSDELRAIVGDVREPYRTFLQSVIEKLSLTATWAGQQLEHVSKGNHTVTENICLEEIYLSKKDLMDDLMIVHRSLCDSGDGLTADGVLIDVIRNVSAFGLTLVPLDVRQESDRHTEALDNITQFLGLGNYNDWDEDTRVEFLTEQLSSNRPLLRPGDWFNNPEFFSPTATDTLETFRMISEQHEDSLGAYVISQATSVSDVLAVLVLQRDAGVKSPLRVVPLFETLDDLKGAAATMENLFSIPEYVSSVGGKQEVMIGYSDSAKDAGRLAASWAQFETQEQLAQVATKHSIDMTFFHGKGGTVGRGGNPATFNAILAHAPHTINGKFRITEQGEMINQNFGTPDRAERTLDIFTAAVLAEHHTPRPSPTDEWREVMNKLSDTSCDAYRKILTDPRFVSYFRSATPELELSNLKIGSRPAKRKATGGVESLRAIPWIMAWIQTRLNLPSWLGAGESIQEMLNDKTEEEKIRRMYAEWGSFRTTVDLIEMVLAKSEPSIAKHYEATLVQDESARELGEEIRGIRQRTEEQILSLTGHDVLSENNALLRTKLQVRNPYVDALNMMQAETIRRLRNRTDEDAGNNKALEDALLTTITGIANGIGNAG